MEATYCDHLKCYHLVNEIKSTQSQSKTKIKVKTLLEFKESCLPTCSYFLVIEAHTFTNSFEAVHRNVRKSRGSPIFVFYCIFVTKFYKVRCPLLPLLSPPPLCIYVPRRLTMYESLKSFFEDVVTPSATGSKWPSGSWAAAWPCQPELSWASSWSRSGTGSRCSSPSTRSRHPSGISRFQLSRSATFKRQRRAWQVLYIVSISGFSDFKLPLTK